MTSPMSILIVDDHEVVRNGIRAYLETLPEFNVVGEAVSGEDAISLVSELIPDIVLLDLIMPHMSGVDVMDALYALYSDPFTERRAAPRIIVITSTSAEELPDEHITRRFPSAVVCVLRKPVDIPMLLASMQPLL